MDDMFSNITNSVFSTLDNNKKMYDYNCLIKKGKVSILRADNDDYIEKIDKKTIVSEAKSNALKKAKGEITSKGIVVINNDLHIEIVIGREGILHSLEQKRNN